MELIHYLILSMLLFVVGAVGFIVKKNVISVFLCLELMLNAVNLSFVAFASHLNQVHGQIFVFFVMVVAAAEAAGSQPDTVDVRTSWWKTDNVFFEARGTAWALVHFFRAAEFDFAHVLEDKNAEASVRQIIRELEASLSPLRSPMVLNGGGYGLTANHSLVMANYLARANAAVINLRELLDQG